MYSRITARTLGGFAVMLGVLALIDLDPAGGIDRPLCAGILATALGSVAGFGIGPNEARALARVRDVDQHGDDLRQERELLERIVENSETGIGIELRDRIVERPGGEFRVESSADQGSTVHFAVPQTASDLDRSEQPTLPGGNSHE